MKERVFVGTSECLWKGASVCGKERVFVGRSECLWEGASVCGKERVFVGRSKCLWEGASVCEKDCALKHRSLSHVRWKLTVFNKLHNTNKLCITLLYEIKYATIYRKTNQKHLKYILYINSVFAVHQGTILDSGQVRLKKKYLARNNLLRKALFFV